MRNEYFEMVKSRLKKYNDLQAQQKLIMSRYLSAGDPYGNMSTDYSQIPAGSHVFNTTSKMEQAIIKNDEWIRANSAVSKEIRELDIAMEPLKVIEREILKLKYVEGNDWGIVASKMGYSERQCKRFAKAGLIRMADVLYGQDSYDLPIYEYLREIS